MNRFFNNILNLVARTKARAGAVEQDFDGIGAGFDLAQVELNAALRAPDGETVARLPSAAVRANKSLVFDATGAPVPTIAATSAEMTAAIAAAADANVAAAAAAAAAATALGTQNALAATIVNVTGATHTAAAGEHCLLSGAAAITVIMPPTPVDLDTVYVTSCNGRVDNLIEFNGEDHMDLAYGTDPTMTLDGVYTSLMLRYSSALSSWKII